MGKAVFSFTLKTARSMDIVPMAKTAGYKSIFIDGEHSSLSVETINDLTTTSLGYGVTPIVRVPGKDAAFITKVLDAGAQGIVVPHIKTVEDVKCVVNASKFHPVGERSITGLFPQFLFEKVDSKLAQEVLNKETLTIPMIETLEALENVEAIAKVKGIDFLLVGSSDLSSALGVPNQYDHPLYVKAIDQILAAAAKAGVQVGIGGIQSYPSIIQTYYKRGVMWFLGEQDNACLSSSMKAGCAKLLAVAEHSK